ncbi:helix-turn-helix transcriptional regulator [Cryobacterium algoritolerans]|uniref:Helix-turn-helix transcriptional regulator n=1 Tax=Cryobacterium algoritolerans TaxID=1259184 RepID=A0A4R8WPX0_9MICO|nr:LuxR C-terminal-related transcriptional regulator [Cryobacterium algoritolerans]TFC12431.1 helix-turn-helix transcriptional regulator [Cryobacterium algoritolerans]
MTMPALLATKLFVPPPRSQAVGRPRLIEQLDAGIRSGRKLTLISAAAGFGKTTLLSDWVAEIRQQEPRMRVAWLSLEASDNDPVRFLGYLVAALQQADTDIGAEIPVGQQPTESTLTTLVNDIARSAHQILLVLDDFQLIEDKSIRDAVVFLLDHLPSTLHLAIASRSDPLLPVARLRARGELTELRAADLRFTPDEAAAFLGPVMGLSLSREDVASLEARTEGWIAGLQLAALSMRDRTDASAFIAAFAGSNRFVIDYLIEEVLERAPLNVREFLYQTAILDRLSGPLCEAVTGQAGGAEMLETLERSNLFVVPLDDRREWFRYHHLFADVLRVRLLAHGPEHVAALNGLASEWFENNHLPEESVRHALAAADFARAARMIEATIPSVRKSRQDATLLGWLALLTDDAISRRPVLGVFSAWASLLSGDIAAVEPKLARAERSLDAIHESKPGPELDTLPVTIALYRASVALATGDLAGIRTHASRALELTSPADHLGRGAAGGLLGLGEWATGDLEAGVAAFADAAGNLRLAGNLTDALSTTMVLADMLIPLGRLQESRRAYEAALREAAVKLGGGPPTADLHGGFAEVLIELGDLAAAEEHLAAGETLGWAAFSHEHQYRWFVSKALLRQAQGDLDSAIDLLEQAKQRYRRGFFAEARPIEAMRARILILQGRLPEAQAWADAHGLTPRGDLSYLLEYAHITLARLLIAQRDPAADELLENLRGAAEAAGREGVVGELRSLVGRPTVEAIAHREGLSERELQVLRLLATELTGPEIARELFVSINTLRTHTRHVFEKLEVNGRPAAIRRAREMGII